MSTQRMGRKEKDTSDAYVGLIPPLKIKRGRGGVMKFLRTGYTLRPEVLDNPPREAYGWGVMAAIVSCPFPGP